MPPLRIRTLLLAVASVVASAAGCADDKVGDPCQLPVEIARQCASDSVDRGREICVFNLSPQCSTGLCMRYLGSADFCTAYCDAAESGACGGDAVCEIPPGETSGICIPAAIYQRGVE